MGDSALPVTRMPFGKHKGTPLRSIPKAYLEWFLDNVEGCQDIKSAILTVLADWILERAEKPAQQRRKKNRKPPRERVNEVAHGSQTDRRGEECPFDVPGEAELDAEYRATVG